jgi:hypothetical protein
MSKRIRVTIDALGNPKIEAEGYAGVGCTEATAPIERALSGKALDRVMKEDAYASEEVKQHQSW